MNFLIFFLYLTLCLIIYILLGFLFYKFIYKKIKKSSSNSLNFSDILGSISNIDSDFWDSSISNEPNSNEFKNKESEVKTNEKIYTSFQR